MQTLEQKQNFFFDNEDDLEIKQQLIKKQSFPALYKNENNTHDIAHEKGKNINIGDYFLTYNQLQMIVTDILETRPLKGVSTDESKRKSITIVKGELVKFTLENNK
jgi:hypothetical protein